MHLRHATFQDQVKVLFFNAGQIKRVGGRRGGEKKKKNALLHPTIKVFTPGSLQQRYEKQEENIEAEKKRNKKNCARASQQCRKWEKRSASQGAGREEKVSKLSPV